MSNTQGNNQPQSQQTAWIRVLDRMPNNEGDVLLLTTSKIIVLGDLYQGKWRVSGRRWEFVNGAWESDVQLSDVTHWMPLPKPPTSMNNDKPPSESSHSPTEQPGDAYVQEHLSSSKEHLSTSKPESGVSEEDRKRINIYAKSIANGAGDGDANFDDYAYEIAMRAAEYEHRHMAAKQAELIAWLQNKVNECQQDHDHHMAHGCSIERINQITGARNAYQRALEFALTTTPKP